MGNHEVGLVSRESGQTLSGGSADCHMPIRVVPGASAEPAPTQRLWCEPRCRAPSRKRYLTSSSTISTMNRLLSKRAASSPNHGFIAHENTFSLASNFVSKNPTSNFGRGPFQILPTLPLITLATSPFSVFRPSLPRIWMRAVGSTPFAMSPTCA